MLDFAFFVEEAPDSDGVYMFDVVLVLYGIEHKGFLFESVQCLWLPIVKKRKKRKWNPLKSKTTASMSFMKDKSFGRWGKDTVKCQFVWILENLLFSINNRE